MVSENPSGTAARNHARLMRKPCVTEPNFKEIRSDSTAV